MILADKIINERKKLGWSQEELADKLDVSRQSVSKWESMQATPDLNRVLKMAEIYWSVIVAAFLGWSFITMRWDITWIIWPVAAVLFGAVTGIVRTFMKD